MTEICPIAAEPVNGVVNMTGRRYNNTVTVTCEDGYQYTGTSVRVCQKDGSWSGKGGFCKGNLIFSVSFSWFIVKFILFVSVVIS